MRERHSVLGVKQRLDTRSLDSAGGIEATSVNWDQIGGTSNIKVREPSFTSLVIGRKSNLSE